MDKDKMLKALKELVYTNEKFNGARVVIDYAIILACEFSNNPGKQNEIMTDYVEQLYKEIDKDKPF